jgi:hypothetical protein
MSTWWQTLAGNKAESNVIIANVPLPFSVGPKPFFPFKLGGRGIAAAIINPWDLLSGDQSGLDHTTAWPVGFLKRWPQFLPLPLNVCRKPSPGLTGELEDQEVGIGPRGCCFWNSLLLVGPALIFFWHPSKKQTLHKVGIWVNTVRWIMRIVLPKIVEYYVDLIVSLETLLSVRP